MVAVYVKSYNTFVFMCVQYYLYIFKNLMKTGFCSCDMNAIGDACKFTMKLLMNLPRHQSRSYRMNG